MTTPSTLLHAMVLATCFAVYVKGVQPPEMTGLRRALQTMEIQSGPHAPAAPGFVTARS